MYFFTNLKPVHCSMSGSSCWFLTCIQISQEAGKVVYSHLLKNFPQFIVIHAVKGFGSVNKAEIDVFLELSCFFNDPTDVGIWFLVPLPFRRDWGQEEKGMTEDEMAGWHHRLDRLESEWTPGVGDGQGGLACCDSWGRKESETTEWRNWTELMTTNYLWMFYCKIKQSVKKYQAHKKMRFKGKEKTTEMGL